MGTGCASAGTLPMFPRPHLYTTKLTGILVGSRVSRLCAYDSPPPFLHPIPISGSYH